MVTCRHTASFPVSTPTVDWSLGTGPDHTHLQVVELMLGIDVNPHTAAIAVDEGEPEVDGAQ